jgi:hypothetical protein
MFPASLHRLIHPALFFCPLSHAQFQYPPPELQAAARQIDERAKQTDRSPKPVLANRAALTPERQRINPFFTGGDVISVSFPTDGMSHEQKLMSMRDHEIIPGHFLRRFMSERYRTILSLSLHLEKMTAWQCVDYLANRVGHERENAAAEVRRSFEADYETLDQSASGRPPDRTFTSSWKFYGAIQAPPTENKQ